MGMEYRAPFFLRGAHFQTIYPALFRRVTLVTNVRERIRTPDSDFVDLDWARKGARRLAVITHGLEGHSRSHYCQGMARALHKAGWDVLAWNFRGCSGQPNHKLRSYHSGATEELQTILNHIFRSTSYSEIGLVGFSLGGNLTLKYLGDCGKNIDPRIRGAVTFSVPCDLAHSARQLEHWSNRIYMSRFMRSLRTKVYEKAARFPGEISTEGLNAVRTFAEFDNIYTGPIHGFKNADDYWTQSSCKNRLQKIAVPTLLVNALDDPFLTPECYPREAAKKNTHFQLETPKYGGHMGFVEFNKQNDYWSERRSVAFLEDL